MLSARRIVPVVVLLAYTASSVIAEQRDPELAIVAPAPGQTVTGPDVAVRVSVTNIELGGQARNGAHVLLRLDDLPAIKSYGERFTFRGVAEGTHRLRAELRRPDGGAFDPRVHAEVSFVVAPAAGASR